MSNRTLALAFGIPAALILVVIAVAITFPNAFPHRTTSMMGVAYPTSAPAPMMNGGDAFYSGSAGEKVAYDRGIISPVPPQTGGQTAAEVDQKIIKTGSLDLVVDDVSESASKIGVIATGKGGFVQSSSVTEREDGTHYGSVTIRIPAKDFEAAVAEVKAVATLVKSENASGQDVTEQYTDLQARLKNAQNEEAAFLDVLHQAHTVTDILAVEQQLFQIRAEIESLKGQIKYLENVTAYSTLSVSLSEEPAVRVPTKEFRPLTTVKEAAQALFAVFQNLIVVLIWVIIVGGGTVLPLVLVAWAIAKLVKNRRMRR